MPAYVLGKGLNRHVYLVVERIKEHARCPGVVERYRHSLAMGHFHNCGDVLYFHCEGTGALAPHQTRVRFDKAFDSRADQRLIVFHFHTVPTKHMVGKSTAWAVDTVRHQHMIAECRVRQVHQLDPRLSTWS